MGQIPIVFVKPTQFVHLLIEVDQSSHNPITASSLELLSFLTFYPWQYHPVLPLVMLLREQEMPYPLLFSKLFIFLRFQLRSTYFVCKHICTSLLDIKTIFFTSLCG